jgi:agmatine deiminase
LAVAEAARTISDYLPVEMLVHPAAAPLAQLQLAGKAELTTMELDDAFPGEFGPLFLCNGEGAMAGADFAFNGWGNSYRDYRHNEAFAEGLLRQLDLPRYRSPLVLEAASLDADGMGTLLASADTILNSNRNPMFDEQQVESRLALHLGVRRIIWLEGLPGGGARQGQLIDLARFIAPNRIACAVAREVGDPVHDLLLRNLRTLADAGRTSGRQAELVEIPVAPSESDGHGGVRVRSYLNFLILPDALLMPVFGVAEDDIAATLLAEQFPGRKVRRLPAEALLAHGNGLCGMTLIMPA